MRWPRRSCRGLWRGWDGAIGRGRGSRPRLTSRRSKESGLDAMRPRLRRSAGQVEAVQRLSRPPANFGLSALGGDWTPPFSSLRNFDFSSANAASTVVTSSCCKVVAFGTRRSAGSGGADGTAWTGRLQAGSPRKQCRDGPAISHLRRSCGAACDPATSLFIRHDHYHFGA